eukprot:CAMPEP_0173383876 /NCGR_PEP_ID=MMETSP1356-20130122/6448_1 /TAXON_ID=77927 ORGANISM="Hemiselmis virescens, Strain PCC157" /NCGR_SAMPLE_ID=MMETSP1356 /ASSEMBLY_ACC=CAM_ASM_000847 /LENGTH=80 /DNA_ID=CAMNT_0014338947 /DNA_START=82 /DNA_END=324 /DNA_ORIENTATION=-
MTSGSRVECYNNRDFYFECLDKNGEDVNMCKALGDKYEATCLKAWVQYFNMQRKRLKAQGKEWASPNMEGERGSANPVRA